MKHFILSAAIALSSAAAAHAATIIDNNTQGLYNAGLGRTLDGLPADFPGSGMFDPTNSYGPSDAPDLSDAAGALGSWLTTPTTPGGAWSSAPVTIPSTWLVEDETAIIYSFEDTIGFENLELSLGVDNGIFVWLNGTFVGGGMAPLGSLLGEYTFSLGSVGAGQNFLQILREDHGGETDYDILLTGDAISAVPLPAGLPLLLVGLGALGVMRKRRS